MVNKSDFHGIPYINKKRKSPHGFLVGYIYKIFQKHSVLPDDVVIRDMRKGANLLDMGCGDGDFCFKNDFNFDKIIGIDVSDFRIRNAIKKSLKLNHKKYIFQTGDMDSKLPFRSGYFDTIVMIAAFQYCFDPYFTLRELNRVLKKGGVMYIQVTNLAWIVYRIQLLFGKQLFTSLAHFQTWDGGILHYFTFKSLSDLINKCGFKVTYKSCSGLFRNIKLIYPSLLASDIIIKAIKK